VEGPEPLSPSRTLLPVPHSIVLASQSPHRRALLERAGYRVTVNPTGIPEPEPLDFGDLHTGLSALALMKGRAAVRQGARGLILACDTVGHAEREVLQKPVDRADAERMLRKISDEEHEVLTGWCLLRSDEDLALTGVVSTRIAMRPWTEAELAAYLDSGDWQGKCGAYGLQTLENLELSDPFVTRIVGSASNVIGVPLERIAEVLAKFPALTAPLE
jgi:septum formation protein